MRELLIIKFPVGTMQ